MRFVKYLAVVCLIITSFSLAACSPQNWFAPKPYKEEQFLMDTLIEITAYGPNAEQAVKAAFDEFRRLHELTNNFDPNSQVSKINQMAGKEKVRVDSDLIQMVKEANEVSGKMEGAFDITIGPLTSLWGIGHKGEFVPSPDEIKKLLPLVDYRLVEVDQAANTIYLPKPGMMLDLGAVAKETAVRKASALLKKQGITSALINAGGDIRVIGNRPDGSPWRIGVQHPRKSDAVLAVVPLTSWDTMETSGDYQRYIMKDNVRYGHILDPHTGYQPRQLASVTLISNSVANSDVFTTALFVLGPQRGMELLKQFPGIEAIFVTSEGKVILTPGLQGKAEITGE